MELPVSRATLIALENFPKYYPPEATQQRSEHIAQFLRNLLAKQMSQEVQHLRLPSLSQLAMVFQCPYLEIYDAFRSLRAHGFDFTLAGLDTPVEIWRYRI